MIPDGDVLAVMFCKPEIAARVQTPLHPYAGSIIWLSVKSSTLR